ncbi:hypothetical protein NM688_g8873 [Phlebia brevispora]|uniref:Uncharacterized protein n=1 Tax=Phlebia brevispora TaxID=194682 RepID=A0ACC1RN87_9APHY|nr:hypothetical protein NM688_g8873 [Phlebia brevispora]
MDQIASELAEYLASRVLTTPPEQRFIVGIAGVPASGKSTLSHIVVDRTNRILRERLAVDGSLESHDDIAVLVGLDGWHLTRAQLDAFPDPKLAHDRRGAYWTFDGESYVDFVRQLREPLPTTPANKDDPTVIYAPSFSHELKDPKPQAVSIYPWNRLVIIEGLYPFLNIQPWVEAGRMLDERWWVELGEDEARTRLVTRHVLSGVAKDLEEAEWRAKENDAPNGRFIKANMLEPTRIIHSVEDATLRTLSPA